jgi:hypothetical protein
VRSSVGKGAAGVECGLLEPDGSVELENLVGPDEFLELDHVVEVGTLKSISSPPCVYLLASIVMPLMSVLMKLLGACMSLRNWRIPCLPARSRNIDGADDAEADGATDEDGFALQKSSSKAAKAPTVAH